MKKKIAESKRDILRAMLKEDMPIDHICECLNLNKDQVVDELKSIKLKPDIVGVCLGHRDISYHESEEEMTSVPEYSNYELLDWELSTYLNI